MFKVMMGAGLAWLLSVSNSVAADEAPLFARKDCPSCGNIYFVATSPVLTISKITINHGKCLPFSHEVRLDQRAGLVDAEKTYRPLIYPLQMPLAQVAKIVALDTDMPFFQFKKPDVPNICSEISEVSVETNLGNWQFGL
jgi:hypothetical protein